MGNTSASCGVNGTDLVGGVPSSAQSSSHKGASPQAVTLLGGVKFITWRLGRHFLGKCRPTGPEAFWGNPGGSGLEPCTRTNLKKGIVLYSSGRWDDQQIPLISINWIQYMGHTSPGHGVNGTDLVECVLSLDLPRASGGRLAKL